MGEEPIHRIEMFFQGRVQGVGFRYQTLDLAKGYEVTGYVRNLADGRVELQVEGVRSEAQKFVEELCQQMSFFIRDVEQSSTDGPRRYEGFTIR